MQLEVPGASRSLREDRALRQPPARPGPRIGWVLPHPGCGVQTKAWRPWEGLPS